MPDGAYRAEERYDTDCFEPMDIPIRARLTKSGDELTVDFTGTNTQIRGFKNSSLANTYSAVYAGLASFFEADLPRNEGTFRSVTIIAPEGTLVNARPPAPVTMCTVFPAHEIMHIVWWALVQADPSRALAGWGKNSFPISSGRDARDRVWVMYHWGGNSGGGAATTRDGFNQMGPMITLGGLTIPNAETYERLYPVMVRRHELRCDGGGAGSFRGGTGVEYEVDIETPSEFSFRSEGTTRSTGLGVAGGRGRPNRLDRGHGAGQGYPYGATIWADARRTGQACGSLPGGGGVGDPLQREIDNVVRDVRDGLVSVEQAEATYGVVMAPSLDKADAIATAVLRTRIAQSRDEKRGARP